MLITGEHYHSSLCSEFLLEVGTCDLKCCKGGEVQSWLKELNPDQLKCLHNAKYCQKGNPKFQISRYFKF